MRIRQLYHKDGRPVAEDDEVTSFRGEKYIVTGWATNGRNRVWVRLAADLDGDAEFYPEVFDLSWEKPA